MAVLDRATWTPDGPATLCLQWHADNARATDERMIELLAPSAGRRGRVVRAVVAHGRRAPKFGAKQRILAMSRW